ncbi:MAG: PilZ domain-containing protein [Desulfobacteraceae bacterium]|nr:PilZ domain-containing protein [Desulfobacteraceae bacterium]
METSADRREFTRFIPRDNAFVALPQVGRMGSIKDISLGGMSCDYYVSFGEDGSIKGETDAPLPADIFVSGKKFFLGNILCQVTYDMIAPEERPAYRVSVDKRRCGLKFDEFSEEQRQQITLFLENHTVGNA